MKRIIANAVNSRDFGNSQPVALIEMIFEDLVVLLKFIHLAQEEGLFTKPFLFTKKIEYLDSIWHHFILHTRLYEKFCMENFGEYLHHEPESAFEGAITHNSKKIKKQFKIN